MPDTPPIDGRSHSAEDRDMEARIAKLESDVTAIKIDDAVIKATGTTKVDIAALEIKLEPKIDEAKTTIIRWVVNAIFLGQIRPHLFALFGK